MLGTAISWALALALTTAGPSDPRIRLIDLQIDRDLEAALVESERLLADQPRAAQALGVDYLRARLLLETERMNEALEALAASMTATPNLRSYSRFRLAEAQAALGRDEVAAGLLASLLGSGTPKALVDPALRLFERTLARGGDCRLLRGVTASRFNESGRRRLQLIRATCAAQMGDQAAATTTLFQLLEADRGDGVARSAADLLETFPGTRTVQQHMTLGLAFHEHREFPLAIQHLARALARLPGTSSLSRSEVFDLRYAQARSHFWQRRYTVAAAAFSALAGDTRTPELRSKVLFQQGRCHELDDDWEKAIETFARAYAAAPGGGWVDSTLLGQLRLLWRLGREREALDAYETLARRRRIGAQTRALMFMAASDLVQGRRDRAGAWLVAAGRLGRVAPTELAYWQGRLAELEGDRARAVDRYLSALRADAFDPFSVSSRTRLTRPELLDVTRRVGARLAGSRRRDDLFGAWLLLGNSDTGRGAQRILRAQLAKDPQLSPYLQMALRPPSQWPLWQSPLSQPEELLLALGLWQEGAPAVARHFPINNPVLAYTGSLLLAQSGETKRSLYIAEVLRKRIPVRLPTALLPEGYQRLLYPFRYGYLILREAERRGIDPYLLAAIIREESRFDPRAFSGASARGLTQFVFPTAREIAESIALDNLEPHDLEQPEVSIALGAAYLQRLSAEFGGDRAAMVAAYNAGEPQAALWRRYCFSDDAAEFFTKVTFRETRNYVLKVHNSHAHYVSLYANTYSEPSRP